MSIFKFEPIYKQRVWGGTQFSELFENRLSKNQKYGESWNIVDREDDQSLCKLDTDKKISITELSKLKATK